MNELYKTYGLIIAQAVLKINGALNTIAVSNVSG
jgi:hypothetical protein